MTTRFDAADHEFGDMLSLLRADLSSSAIEWDRAREDRIWQRIQQNASPTTHAEPPHRSRLMSMAAMAAMLCAMVGGAWWNGQNNDVPISATATELSSPAATPTVTATPFSTPLD